MLYTKFPRQRKESDWLPYPLICFKANRFLDLRVIFYGVAVSGKATKKGFKKEKKSKKVFVYICLHQTHFLMIRCNVK